MDATAKQLLVGAAVALPSFLLGVLGWIQLRRTGKQDYSSKKIDQLLQGYRSFTEEVQKDNEDLRAIVGKLQDQYKLCEEGRVKLTREHSTLKQEHKELKDAVAQLGDK